MALTDHGYVVRSDIAREGLTVTSEALKPHALRGHDHGQHAALVDRVAKVAAIMELVPAWIAVLLFMMPKNAVAEGVGAADTWSLPSSSGLTT